MRKFTTCFMLLFILLPLSAQKQPGQVVIQNSGKKTLPQVEIIVADAQPTTSDARGDFQIHLPNHVKGQRLMIQSIAYKDWVVVNKQAIAQWVYAPEKTYRIDMCPRQEYTQRVEQLYEIGQSCSRAQYDKVVAELKQLKEKGRLSSAEYMQRRKAAQASLNSTKSMLDQYIPLIAAINTDYLLPVERQAQQLVMEGKLDEAIRLYEEMKLDHKARQELQFEHTWSEDIEMLIPSVERFAQTLILEGGQKNYERAGSYLKMIADSDPKHMQRNANYAIFAGQQGLYSEAEIYYKKAIEATENPLHQADWYTKLGVIYDYTGQLNASIDAYIKATDLLAPQPRNLLATAELFVYLDLNMSSCLYKMAKILPVEKKEEVYQRALNCLEETQNILETLKEMLISNYQHPLLLCYNNIMHIYVAQKDAKGMRRIQEKIDRLPLTDGDDEYLLDTRISQGVTALHQQRNTASLDYLMRADTLAEKLYQENPQKFKFKRGQIHELLGCAYYDLNRYEEAIRELTDGLVLFGTYSNEEKELQKELYYDLNYNLILSYYYNKQYVEAWDLFPAIYPYLGDKDIASNVAIWMVMLHYAYLSGNYDILKYEQDIVQTLQTCQADETYYTQAEAAYTLLGALKLQTGQPEEGMRYYDLSDQCATLHKHNRMLAYGNLNRMNALLINHQPQAVLSIWKETQSDLKKYHSDADGFVQLAYYKMLAHLMLRQWDEAALMSQQLTQGSIPDDPFDQCKVFLTQALLNARQGKEYQTIIVRMNKQAQAVLKTSLFRYWELMSDYHLAFMHHHLRQKDYTHAMFHLSEALNTLGHLGKESYVRCPFLLSYLLNRYGDIAYAQADYVSALKAYEDALTTFFDFHTEQKKACYTYMYDWNATLWHNEDFLNFEKTIRTWSNAQDAMLHQAFIMVLYVLHQDAQVGKALIDSLKTRKLPDTNMYYPPALVAVCQQMDGKLPSEYQSTLKQLINLLQ